MPYYLSDNTATILLGKSLKSVQTFEKLPVQNINMAKLFAPEKNIHSINCNKQATEAKQVF